MSTFPPVQPHGPIETFGDDVFFVQGSVRMGPGVRINRNMVIVRSGTDLALISAVRLCEEEEKRLTDLGDVRHVVKIGHFHGMDDAYSLDRFGADYWTLPGGARPRDPSPTRLLRPGELPIPDAELFEFRDAREPEAALLVNRAGGILITCDSVQHHPDTRGCSLIGKALSHALGFTRRPAQIGLPWRKSMTPRGKTLRADFERLASLHFSHLIAAHGAPLRDTARADLRATIQATFS